MDLARELRSAMLLVLHVGISSARPKLTSSVTSAVSSIVGDST